MSKQRLKNSSTLPFHQCNNPKNPILRRLKEKSCGSVVRRLAVGPTGQLRILPGIRTRNLLIAELEKKVIITFLNQMFSRDSIDSCLSGKEISAWRCLVSHRSVHPRIDSIAPIVRNQSSHLGKRLLFLKHRYLVVYRLYSQK